ncbi:MAG TPA: formate dehydrogenase accessory sulfurtransferase FdhD [Stellaceae bacterium]|nr:formate dehydrogenase accessory sulfurtransferase FdhD [Stellaceae bacterium]
MSVEPTTRVTRAVWRKGIRAPGERTIPEESAIAFSYNRFAYAVMMGSPADLEDFAIGFSVTQGIISAPEQIVELETRTQDEGIELRLWLDETRSEGFGRRRRYLAGPSGCGLCGVESLAEAMRPPPPVTSRLTLSFAQIMSAIAALAPAQPLHQLTRATHAAGFWTPERGLIALREDVGRHNALDKLAGALSRAHIAGGSGAVVLTSRVSVEMVQKTAYLGSPILIAVSAPTALAVRAAEEAGVTLIAIAREDGFETFTHPERLLPEPTHHVA